MARLSADGTKVLDNYDRFMGTPFNASIVTTWYDGTAMDDSKVDNVIYFKNQTAIGGYARRDFDTIVNLKWFGAKGDGITSDSAPLQKAVDFCVRTGYSLYVPTGIYILNSGDFGPITLSNWTSARQGLTMFGDGRGKSIFREGNGQTNIGGRFTKMFYCYNGASDSSALEVGSYTFMDLTFDKNGRSNVNLEPNTFYYEQAHIIAWQGGGPKNYDAISFDRCEFIDKIGACINMSSSTNSKVRQITIKDIQSTYHPSILENGGPFGQRGCVEFGVSSLNTIITETSALYVQIEPVTDSSITNQRNSFISNSKIDIVEFTDRGGYTFLNCTNLTCKTKFLTRGMQVKVSNSTLKMTQVNTAQEMIMTGCSVLCDYDAGTNVVTPFTFGFVTGATLPYKLIAIGCSFKIDSDDPNIVPTGVLVSGGGTGPRGNFIRSFYDCEWDSRCDTAVDAYANGHWNFFNCIFRSRNLGILVGGFGTNGFHINMYNCNLLEVVNAKIRLNRNNTLWTLSIYGNYNPTNFYSTTGSSDLKLSILVHPTFYNDTTVSSFMPQGSKIVRRLPLQGEVIAYVNTQDTTHVTTGWMVITEFPGYRTVTTSNQTFTRSAPIEIWEGLLTNNRTTTIGLSPYVGTVKLKNNSNFNWTIALTVGVTINGVSDNIILYPNNEMEIYCNVVDTYKIVSQIRDIVDTTSVAYTKTTINIAYPMAKVGTTVIQDLAGLTYIKKDNSSTGNWSFLTSSQLA